jgi:hypothetical protein
MKRFFATSVQWYKLKKAKGEKQHSKNNNLYLVTGKSNRSEHKQTLNLEL